ncbi:MAG: hypothetical protein L0216_21425 [Planctomycetales bacterium]|nr:hypothetical protein [Planctomycetales bacterium]
MKLGFSLALPLIAALATGCSSAIYLMPERIRYDASVKDVYRAMKDISSELQPPWEVVNAGEGVVRFERDDPGGVEHRVMVKPHGDGGDATTTWEFCAITLGKPGQKGMLEQIAREDCTLVSTRLADKLRGRSPPEGGRPFCGSCGCRMAPDTRFCQSCGAKRQ